MSKMTQVDSAVSFAASMLRKDVYIGKAIRIAANYYKVAYDDVQRGLASRSGKSRKGKKQDAKPMMICQYCNEQEATIRLQGYYGYNLVWEFFLCEKCNKSGAESEVASPHLDRIKRSAYKATKADKEGE